MWQVFEVLRFIWLLILLIPFGICYMVSVIFLFLGALPYGFKKD